MEGEDLVAVALPSDLAVLPSLAVAVFHLAPASCQVALPADAVVGEVPAATSHAS